MLLGTFCAATVPVPLEAQAFSRHKPGLWSSTAETGTPPSLDLSLYPVFLGQDQRPATGPGPGTAFVMSALIPGLSQQKSGKRRWLLYAGTEIIALTYYAQRRSRANSLRDQYRDLAWTEARSYQGQRQDPEFPYYEAMGKWVKSGAWDTDQESGVQPEGDPSTFNGSVWLLAKDIFLAGEEGTPGSASYARALGFYQTKAHRPAFLWDWTGKSDQMNRFNDLIVDSDGRFAQATNAVGLLIANHLLSALDGMVSARLRSTDSRPGHFGLHVSYYVP